MSSQPMKGRVIVGLSGGVESSVAALLLKQQGYEVHGLFMFNWLENEDDYCSAAEDFQDARGVCAELEIPLHRANFSREYLDRVFAYFLSEYESGRTPNPDVLCNREIKFGVFFDYARRLGAQWVATGHYARVVQDDGEWQLLKAADHDKDQSYFLHAVEPACFEHILFPLGEITKNEVRLLARQAGFQNFSKRDSTGICFIGERPFREFLEHYVPAQPGEIQSADGRYLGTHQGLMFYTLGQRQGLGIGGVRDYSEAPWYVVDKILEQNILIVAQGHEHPRLMSDILYAEGVKWIGTPPTKFPFDCAAKTRYRQTDQACRIEPWQGDGFQVTFATPQRAVTPGQFVVFYENDLCLGGGVIAATQMTVGESRTSCSV